MNIMLLFGHLFGDFFFQTKSMAENKYLSGKKGFLCCSLHTLIYTLTVMVFAQNYAPIFFLGMFLPHWIVDRYSLGYQWMKLIGRGELLTNPQPDKPSFGPIIYVVIDQTMHLVCLYLLSLMSVN